MMVDCPSCLDDRYAASHDCRQSVPVCYLCGCSGQVNEDVAREWSELKGKRDGAWAAKLAAERLHDSYLDAMGALVRLQVARREKSEQREVSPHAPPRDKAA